VCVSGDNEHDFRTIDHNFPIVKWWELTGFASCFFTRSMIY
jgi:hypothetical protein